MAAVKAMGGPTLMPPQFAPSTGPLGAVRRLKGNTFLPLMSSLLDVAGKRSQAMNRACSRAGCVGTAKDAECATGGIRGGQRVCCANEGGAHATPTIHEPTASPIPVRHWITPTESLYWQNLWMWPTGHACDAGRICGSGPETLWYVPGRVIQVGDFADVARLLGVSYWRRGHPMSYGVKARLLVDLAAKLPDVDTLLVTSHRDSAGSSGLSCSAELVSLRTAEWNPFGCPEHPALRRGSAPGPCDCKTPSKVECYDAPKFAKNNAARRFDCTPSWIKQHEVVC